MLTLVCAILAWGLCQFGGNLEHFAATLVLLMLIGYYLTNAAIIVWANIYPAIQEPDEAIRDD